MPNAGEWLRKDTPFRRALFIAVLYAVVAGLWIAFSDRALARMIDDPLAMAWAQTVKGWSFVLVTAFLLFLLVHRAAHGLLRGYRAAMNATRDDLTGLAGPTALRELAPRLIERAKAIGEPAAFILLDVVRLHRVNDALGVGAGNAVLMEMARRLRRLHRPDITLTRPGSDEFLLMVAPPCSQEEAESIARQALSTLHVPYDVIGEPLDIRLRAGIAMYPSDGRNIDELIHAAEKAVVDAKGSDAGIAFYRKPNKQARQLLSIESALARALDKGQFQLHYQPLVDLRSGVILGAEALLRWEHPRLGSVSPGHFIPLLEQSGGIHEAGAWVFETAVKEMHRWPRQNGCDPRVCVNVSRAQLETPEFQQTVQSYMKRSGADGAKVVLEITESMAMQNPEVILARLETIKQYGLLLAMDDFGTGYSSLSYLKRFPFDYVKIDRAFVRGIPEDTENDLLVQTMWDMTQRLGRETVAEGIERWQEVERLRDLGFRTGQGFLFSRPLSSGAFSQLMNARHRYEVREAVY